MSGNGHRNRHLRALDIVRRSLLLRRRIKRIVPTNKHNVVHPRMRTTGALDKYAYIDATNALGREFRNAQLSDIVADDSKIKDLAITGK